MHASPGRGRTTTFSCPNCGAEVKSSALACPECGSDRETGWAENADSCSPDIPGSCDDDDFDYDAFVKREFESPDWPLGLTPVRLVAVAVCALFVLWLLKCVW